ncbi:hypothetical protein ACIBCM_15595 [Streptomyces sp. NPDC051018]|uniref:hypothetical protein n=1 Tax=Streptomyces sp. NPDC051018 TaxID=3365639 RepID=UPI0037AB6CF3
MSDSMPDRESHRPEGVHGVRGVTAPDAAPDGRAEDVPGPAGPAAAAPPVPPGFSSSPLPTMPSSSPGSPVSPSPSPSAYGTDETSPTGESADERSGELPADASPAAHERAVSYEPAGPAPLGVQRRPTGHAGVDALLERLADADHLTADGHLEVYEDVHAGLRDTLSALDARQGPPVPAPPSPAYDHRS